MKQRVIEVEAGELASFVARSGIPEEFIFVLSDSISDAASFFRSARSTLPLNPPNLSDLWDPLLDSLWEGLSQLQTRELMLIWPQYRRMKMSSSEDFEIALGVLSVVAKGLSEEEGTDADSKELVIVLVR